MNMFIGFLFLLAIIVAVIAVVFIIKMNLKDIKKKEKKQIKNKEKTFNDVEILEVEKDKVVSPIHKEVIKEVTEDTLNLDDLFKTLSMAAVKDDTDFDFGLIRKSKSKNNNQELF